MPPATHDAHRIADDLATARASLLALARQIPETRIQRPTARSGWTLKHELAALAAADAELLRVLGEVRRRPSPVTLDLRRDFAEEMLPLLESRLPPLLARLETRGAELEAALVEHHADLASPVAVEGRDVASAGDLAGAHLERARGAVATLQAALPK